MKFCNGKYEVETDPHNWILIENYVGQSKKTKEPLDKQKITYYANLTQILNEILDRECKECKEISDLKDLLIKAQNNIKEVYGEK